MTRIERALVTGASSGIGTAFARRLAERGVHPVLVARREDRLRALADELTRAHGVEPEVVVADLADPAGRERVAERLRSPDRVVDLLINNAGFGAYGAVHHADPALLERMIAVNVTAVLELTRAALPGLLARDNGGVINVGSTAGERPGPHAAVYGASKAFVNRCTEAVHEEVRGTGVRVLLLAPGFTATAFQEVAGVAADVAPAGLAADPDEVVVAALEAVARGRAVCVPRAADRALLHAARVLPRVAVRRISGMIHARGDAR